MRQFIIGFILISFMQSYTYAVEITEVSEYRKYITETDFDEFNSFTANVFLAVGNKYLEGGNWRPVDDYSEMGVLFDFGREEWPLHIAIDYFTAESDGSNNGIDLDSTITELDVGLRFVMDVPSHNTALHIGAGVSMIDVELEASGALNASDEDSGTGFWINMGGYYIFKDHWLVGVDLRFSDTDVHVLGAPRRNAGYWHTNLIFGVRW